MSSSKLKFIILFILFVFSVSLYGTTNIDSLRKILLTYSNDTVKINALFSIGEYYENFNLDSSIYFYSAIIEIAEKQLSNKNLKLQLKNNYIYLKAKAFRYIGIAYYYKNDYKKAYKYYIESLKLFEEISNKKEIANCFLNIGSIYSDLGNYNKALFYYNKSFKIKEILNDEKDLSICLTNIGLVYYYQGNFKEAINYFLKSIANSKKLNDLYGQSYGYNNLGMTYSEIGNYDSATYAYLEALKIKEKLNDIKGMTICYNNLGIIQFRQENYNEALKYYNEALKLSNQINDKKSIAKANVNIGIINSILKNYDLAVKHYNVSINLYKEINDLRGLAICYNNLANTYKESGNIDEAIKYFNNSLKISQDIGDKYLITGNLSNLSVLNLEQYKKNKNIEKLNNSINLALKAFSLAKETQSKSDLYNAAIILSEAYKLKGLYPKAIEYLEIYTAYKDSVFKEEKTKFIIEAEKKFQAEKKQLQIDKLNKEKELQKAVIAQKEAESKKQKIIITSILIGLLIVTVFSIFVYRLYLDKKKANIIIARKNQQLEFAYQEIKSQKEEILLQRDEIKAQRDLLQEQKKHILDSISYAQRIQKALLPDVETLNKIFNDYFILYLPRDIVSGDFYWATKINEWIIFTVADCTGHGVPGAFMSVLGITFLNDIVRKKEVTKASQVLDILRDNIIEALQQKGITNEQKDGMDIALCTYNTQNNILQYSGANNEAYIIKTNKEFIELKADKQPVAIHIKMNNFKNYEIKLNKGDIIYLTSDGYKDQFGGNEGKKFLSKRFKELLSHISCLKDMEEQKNVLLTTFKEWKKDYEQLDDVTVMGVRV